MLRNWTESRYPTAEIRQLSPELRSDVIRRRSLGLNADVAYVRQLRGSAEDVGSEKTSIPMTQAEYDEQIERGHFINAAEETVIPYVRTLPTFGGLYYDHFSNGDLVISLTDVNPEIRNKINSLAPKGRQIHIRLVDHTQQELRESAMKVFDVFLSEAGGPEIYMVSIDQPTNGLHIEVGLSDVEIAKKMISQISVIMEVPMFVTVGEKPVEQIS